MSGETDDTPPADGRCPHCTEPTYWWFDGPTGNRWRVHVFTGNTTCTYRSHL